MSYDVYFTSLWMRTDAVIYTIAYQIVYRPDNRYHAMLLGRCRFIRWKTEMSLSHLKFIFSDHLPVTRPIYSVNPENHMASDISTPDLPQTSIF